MKKYSTIAIAILVAQVLSSNAWAFGDVPVVAKPVPKPVAVAKPVPVPKPVVVSKPVPVPVAAKTVAKPVPVPVPVPVLKTVSKPKPIKIAQSHKPIKQSVPAKIVSETDAEREQKKREDDVIAFSSSNHSCDSDYAWSRIKDSGFSKSSAPKRVKIAIENSVDPKMSICKSKLDEAKKESTVPQKIDNASMDIKSSAIDMFGKLKDSIGKGQSAPVCSSAQKMLGQC